MCVSFFVNQNNCLEGQVSFFCRKVVLVPSYHIQQEVYIYILTIFKNKRRKRPEKTVIRCVLLTT